MRKGATDGQNRCRNPVRGRGGEADAPRELLVPDLVVHRRPGRDLTVPGAGECELGAGETIRLVTRRSRIRRGQGSGAVAVTTVRNTRIPGRCMDREYSDGLKDGNHGWHHRPYSER